MKASSFSWISRTFSAKQKVYMWAKHRSSSQFSKAHSILVHLPFAELCRLLKFEHAFWKNPSTSQQTWTRMQDFCIFSRIKYQPCQVPPWAQSLSPKQQMVATDGSTLKGMCGWGADDEEVVFCCTSSPPHDASKLVPFRESRRGWNVTGRRHLKSDMILFQPLKCPHSGFFTQIIHSSFLEQLRTPASMLAVLDTVHACKSICVLTVWEQFKVSCDNRLTGLFKWTLGNKFAAVTKYCHLKLVQPFRRFCGVGIPRLISETWDKRHKTAFVDISHLWGLKSNTLTHTPARTCSRIKTRKLSQISRSLETWPFGTLWEHTHAPTPGPVFFVNWDIKESNGEGKWM